MSYVEHCNKHGQYKGDYCGECIDDINLNNDRLRKALEPYAYGYCKCVNGCSYCNRARKALED